MSNALAHGELALFDCPRIRKSEFWQFIKLVAPHGNPPDGRTHWLSQDATDAYCLRCSKMFRFTKGSSNSVRRHMERFHRKELLKRQADNKKNAAAVRRVSGTSMAGQTANVLIPSSSPGSARKPKRPASSQDADLLGEDVGLLGAATQRTAQRSRVDGVSVVRDTRHGVEALVKWLVLTMRPFTIVEDPGFAGFAEAISGDHAFAVPTSDELCHRLELMAEHARFEVKQVLKKEVGRFALTAEIWSARVSSDDATTIETHLSVKCMYLNEDFAVQSYVLDALPVQDFSSDKILRLLQDFGLSKLSLTSFLLPRRDGLEESVKDGDLHTIVDVGSSLDALVGELLCSSKPSDSEEEISSEAKRESATNEMHAALGEVMAFIKWVRSDSTAHAKLEVLYPAAAEELAHFPAEPPSKWSLALAHEIISRMIRSRSALVGLMDQWNEEDVESSSSSPPNVNNLSWLILEGLLVLWRPLYEVVQVASTEKVCSLSFVLPILTIATQLFARTNLFDELKQRYLASGVDEVCVATGIIALDTLRRELESGLRERYECLYSELPWISALDPRYARLRHLSDEEREICKEQLLEHATELYATQLPVIPSPTEALGSLVPHEFESDIVYNGDTRTPTQSMPGLMHRLLYDEDEDVSVTSDPVLSRETELAQARLYAANEISVYLNEHQLRKTRVVCPLQWWTTNRERFPFLAPLARQWLSTRACSLADSSFGRVMDTELSDSLGRKTSKENWLKLAGDLIVLQASYETASSSGVSL